MASVARGSVERALLIVCKFPRLDGPVAREEEGRKITEGNVQSSTGCRSDYGLRWKKHYKTESDKQVRSRTNPSPSTTTSK